MKKIHFSIIGSGYRGLLFAEAAKTYPDIFALDYMYCRTEEKAVKLHDTYHIPVTTEKETVAAAHPDFVVVAIGRDQMAAVSLEWIKRGIPVLCETPMCNSVEELKMLWSVPEVRNGMLLVGEQYHRYPVLAAGLKKIKEGCIGDPQSVYLSLCHDYHGASMIRRCLNHGLVPFTVTGNRFSSNVLETDSRYGRITDGSSGEKIRDIATITFDDGTFALYDFSGLQYRTFLRGRHITVRGAKGEWGDKILYSMGEDGYPTSELLNAWIDPKYRILESRGIKNLLRSLKPELVMEEEEDIFAIASMLYDYGRYHQKESDIFPYPIEEGLEDTYTSILMQQAFTHPGEVIRSEIMPWYRQ